ncbi:hydrogenase maturation nickel metallochaperone HypA [Coprothermobacteraceae bacterium]|nr:hydrogenase maturation nickel metallochaperone HypA [Coprothermobacteraceae bacterium]
MHEYSIAKYVLDSTLSSIGETPPERVSKVVISIGKMAGVVPESLDMYLKLLAQEVGLTRAVFEIVVNPVEFKCNQCGQTFEPNKELFWCPHCGSSNVTFVRGNEMAIDYLEIEEEGP